MILFLNDCTTWSLQDLVGKVEDQNLERRKMKLSSRRVTKTLLTNHNFEVVALLSFFFVEKLFLIWICLALHHLKALSLLYAIKLYYNIYIYIKLTLNFQKNYKTNPTFITKLEFYCRAVTAITHKRLKFIGVVQTQ